jgi:hypothetical protein
LDYDNLCARPKGRSLRRRDELSFGLGGVFPDETAGLEVEPLRTETHKRGYVPAANRSRARVVGGQGRSWREDECERQHEISHVPLLHVQFIPSPPNDIEFSGERKRVRCNEGLGASA